MSGYEESSLDEITTALDGLGDDATPDEVFDVTRPYHPRAIASVAATRGGGLPAQWEQGEGGTVNIELDGDNGVADYTSVYKLVNSDGETLVEFWSAGEFDFHLRDNNTGGVQIFGHGFTGTLLAAGAVKSGADTLGFYGTSPIVQQTGVAVTAAAIHEALVNPRANHSVRRD